MTACFGKRGEEDLLGNRWPHDDCGYSNHDEGGSNERKSRGLGEF